MKKVILIAVLCPLVTVFAEPPHHQSGMQDAFLRNQAYVEMQRVSGQIDALQSSHDELVARVIRMEGGKGEVGAIRSEIDSLRAEIASVRREMQNMRSDIVRELTKKIMEIQKASTPPPQPVRVVQPPAPRGPCKEYTVQPGDTLSLIAQAFGCRVAQIKELNGLKSDGLRVGQKLLVPKN